VVVTTTRITGQSAAVLTATIYRYDPYCDIGQLGRLC